jgi:hypothetical protein
MPATTTSSLAALIPTELISGVLVDEMQDLSNLKGLCAVADGFVSYEFASMPNLTASVKTEGNAVSYAAVVPTGTTVTGVPVEVDGVEVTRLALMSAASAPDWLRMSGQLGIALKNAANTQICDTFRDLFGGNRDSVASTTGAGAPAACDLHTLELALEVAEGNNAVAMPYNSNRRLAIVLHPTQIAGIRANIRASANFIERADILAELGGALPTDGLFGSYYGALIYSSIGCGTAVFDGAAGTGVALATDAAGGAGTFRKGAIFSIGEGVGYVSAMAPEIRTQDAADIVTGGVRLIAGFVGAAARVSPELCLIETL